MKKLPKTYEKSGTYVDLMKISDEETELLTDHKDVREAAKILYEQGVKVVAVTLGGEGAIFTAKMEAIWCRDFQ